jgi:hypothetical protein
VFGKSFSMFGRHFLAFLLLTVIAHIPTYVFHGNLCRPLPRLARSLYSILGLFWPYRWSSYAAPSPQGR